MKHRGIASRIKIAKNGFALAKKTDG